MSTKVSSFDRQTVSIFWSAIKRNPALLWLSLLYPIGTILLNTVVPLYIGKILGSLVTPSVSIAHYVWILVAAGFIGLGCNRYGFTALMALQAKTMSALQTKAFWTLLQRSVGFHNNNISGKLVSDAIDFPQAYSMLSNALFINILPLLLTFITGVIVVFIASPVLGFVVFAMALFMVVTGIVESRNRRPLRTRRLAATKAVTGHLADSIVNAPTVKTFAHEQYELKKHKKLNETLRDMRVTDWRRAATTGNDRIAALFIMQIIYILLVVHEVHLNPALLGIGIYAFSFTITLTNRLFDLNSLIRNIEDGLLQASPMTEIMSQSPEIKDAPGAKPLKINNGKIEFNGVEFQYSDAENDQTVFSNLSLTINPGEKVGLVGHSGGGKSTLTRILLRFEDIGHGHIMIDGQEISLVSQASLREAIAYVPQEPLLFHRPIKENRVTTLWLENAASSLAAASAKEWQSPGRC
jgi:ATP-binding cassette subfamily B protein